ncbi:unnamed protein product, partial [Prorocentrum cordatum]
QAAWAPPLRADGKIRIHLPLDMNTNPARTLWTGRGRCAAFLRRRSEGLSPPSGAGCRGGARGWRWPGLASAPRRGGRRRRRRGQRPPPASAPSPRTAARRAAARTPASGASGSTSGTPRAWRSAARARVRRATRTPTTGTELVAEQAEDPALPPAAAAATTAAPPREAALGTTGAPQGGGGLTGDEVLAHAPEFSALAQGGPGNETEGQPGQRPRSPRSAGHRRRRQSTTESPAAECPPCTRSERDVPDVVIPFYERDLCKVGYTVESIAVHDRHGTLGTVILMWVSAQPIAAFQEQVDKIQASLSGSHKVKVLDFSPQVTAEGAGGWFAQQVFKLKVASLVSSDFYVVLDSKNTLIRDIEPELFFTTCNQGKIFGEFEPNDIPEPHSGWYEASARVLSLPAPVEAGGKWPTSITPMLMHTQTVLEMLASIGEGPSVDALCAGPLCDMLGVHSATGSGATEFTMYVLAARARQEMECDIAVVDPDSANPPAISLWRGEGGQMKINGDNCRDISSGKTVPFMFGAQYQSLDGLDDAARATVEADMLRIFTQAKLHNASLTSTDALLQCVAGDMEGRAGPVLDLREGSDESDGGGDEEDAFCCTGASDAGDVCGTCFAGAREGPGSFCGASAEQCLQCGAASWCGAPGTVAQITVMEDDSVAPMPRQDAARAAQWAAGTAAAALAAASAVALARRAAPRSSRLVVYENLAEAC